MLSRREALSAAAGAASNGLIKRAPAKDGPEEALMAFLRAFEDCDLPRMEAAFARDATCFDRAPREAGDLVRYRRKTGMPDGMRQLAMNLPKSAAGPPYQRIDPRNLACDVYGEIALCTFELDGPDSLGRRTIILRRQEGGWKIIHIHASNVYPKAE